MLQFYPDTTATVFLTLAESVTLIDPAYLFIFRPRVAGPAVYAELLPTEQNERSDRFEIDVNALFAGRAAGLWLYEVRECPAPAEDEPNRIEFLQANMGEVLEEGLLQLHGSSAPRFIQPDSTISFIQP